MTPPGGDLAIEWRESDDHVRMTGPVEYEFAAGSTRRCSLPPTWRKFDERRCRYLRLQAQRLRVGSDSPRGRARRLERHGRGQYLCGDRRSGAPGASIDPASPPRAAVGPHRRHWLRGADRAETFAAMAEADRVLGNTKSCGPTSEPHAGRASPSPISASGRAAKSSSTTSWRSRDHAALDRGFAGRARAFVQVQNGCDHRCTFCIIPYGRGNSRSVPMGAVVAELHRLAANGYREVVLTGVDLTSYGAVCRVRPGSATLVKQICQARAGARAVAVVIDRFGRGRSRSARRLRRTTPA